MSQTAEETLTDLLDRLEGACSGQARVSVEDVHQALGQRAFGPLLLLAGLAALTPVGLVPGAPTLLALIVLLIAGQLAFGAKAVWLPKVIGRRTIAGERLAKAIRFVRRPAAWMDRIARPRLPMLLSSPGIRAAAAMCIAIAFAIPPLELVPFGVAAPASAITAFGLGLIARDGLLILVAWTASAAAVGLLVFWLLT